MIKGLMITGLTALIFSIIHPNSHELWILPAYTHVLAGQRVALQLMMGDNFTGERWKGKGKRVITYNHYHHNQTDELLLSLAPGENLIALPDFIPSAEGTHLLALATNHNFIESSADEFNDFLKENGQMTAYRYRVANNEKFKKGREKVRRCAKVLIQAGEESDNTFKENTNLVLEIIPEKNPYTHDRSEGLTFKVLYEDTPLPDAMVRWWHKDKDSMEQDFLFTSEKGEVTFSAAQPGIYMISLVHTERLNNDNGADWQSTWSSLVFGMEE